ncbi:MAG: cation transporter [Symbiobacteriaceae bacterium]|nr:cation transporter [Symbiobacteriaceae bacterium]
MKKSFKLEGLNCAHCAGQIEEGVAKLDGVTHVTMNFATTRLTIEGENDKMDNIVAAAMTIIKQVEPHIEVKKA